MSRKSTYEKQVEYTVRSGWVNRYLEMCHALGTLPPSKAEMDRMRVFGPPAWFQPVRDRDQSHVVQLTSRAHGGHADRPWVGEPGRG